METTVGLIEQLLAEAHQLMARDVHASQVPLPASLAELPIAVREVRSNWENHFADLHPADRVHVARAWFDTRNVPGHLVRCRSRWHDQREGELAEVRFLNLLDDPGYGCILVAVAAVAGTWVEPDTVTPEMSVWEPQAWVMNRLADDGTVLSAEGSVEKLFGRPASDLVGRLVTDLIHPDDQPAALATWIELLRHGGASEVRMRIVHPDGTERWVETTIINRLAEPSVEAVLSISHDVGERRDAERRVAASDAQFRLLAEGVPAAVFRASVDGSVEFGNRRWAELALDPTTVFSLVGAADLPAFARAWQGAIAAGPGGSLDVETSVAHLTMRWRANVAEGADLRPVVLGVVEDVTDTVRLRKLAVSDPLTGAANRRALENHLDELLTSGRPVSVLFVDLDDFKEVNDRYGHIAGDAVLRGVAAVLVLTTRADDLISRYGGDEFVVVCPDLDEFGAEALGAVVEGALKRPLTFPGGSWAPHASIGVVVAEAGDTAADVLARADAAMYARKRERANAAPA